MPCRSIVTDEYLCVKGSNGRIYALGDAATVEQPKALSRAKVGIITVHEMGSNLAFWSCRHAGMGQCHPIRA